MARRCPSTRPCARILDGVEPTAGRDRRHRGGAPAARWPSRWPRCSRSRRSMPPPWTAMPCARPTSRRLPATLAVIGEAAAGHPFAGSVGAGQAVRIFTGAPVPAGADAIVIQENTDARRRTASPCATARVDTGHIRRTGFDFRAGETLLAAGRRLGPREVSLAAAMGHGTLAVRRRPRVAVLSTGDELVPPGQPPGPGPDRLLQSPGRRRAGRGRRRRGRSSSASPATRARASTRTSPRPRAPTSSSPSAAPRSAITTSSRPVLEGARHGAGVLEDRHAAGQAADVRPPGRRARAGPAGQSGLVAGVHARVPGAADARAARASRRTTTRPLQARAARRARGQRPAPALHARHLGARRRRPRPWSRPCAPRTAPCWRRWRRPTACWSAPASAPAAAAGSLVPILPLDF